MSAVEILLVVEKLKREIVHGTVSALILVGWEEMVRFLLRMTLSLVGVEVSLGVQVVLFLLVVQETPTIVVIIVERTQKVWRPLLHPQLDLDILSTKAKTTNLR